MEKYIFIFLISLIILYILYDFGVFDKIFKMEKFVSGDENFIGKYDTIYPFDDPRYATPQQKEFQVSMCEHPALDYNLQKRRTEIKTQLCKKGDKCFSSKDYHEINHNLESSPAIINTKIGLNKYPEPCVKYVNFEDTTVLPYNATSKEKRADLYDDGIIPDLFFKRNIKCKINVQ